MSDVLHSAGDPGASRCSATATGSSKARSAACEALFAEMLPLLCSIRDMSSEAIANGADKASEWTAVNCMASMAGALADRGLQLYGDPGAVGGWDDWITSPSLREAMGQLGSHQQASTTGDAA